MSEDASNKPPSKQNPEKETLPDGFPPKLTGWELKLTVFFDSIFILALGFGICLCFIYISNPQGLPSCICWVYFDLFAILVGVFGDRYLRHKVNLHKSRLEDPSEILALFNEAETVEPRLTKPETKPDRFEGKKDEAETLESRLTKPETKPDRFEGKKDEAETLESRLTKPETKPDRFEGKKDELREVVQKLRKEGLGCWTEYKILPINQKLVEFFKIDDLKAQAQSSLSELCEYAEDSAYRYDRKLYDKWETRIHNAEDKIKDVENEFETGNANKDDVKDDAAEQLRAEFVMLLEHLANYKKNWAHGSAIIRDLMICGFFAVPGLILMGIIPGFYPPDVKSLSIINWGFLGISGSLTSVLLYLYKSDKVEVGNTEGKSEIWRAVVGATLGFVAGILIFSMIAGGLISAGSIVPDIWETNIKNNSLSILWAVGVGMFFENIFERMRGTFAGAS